MTFSLEYAKMWSDYENSYKCESYEKDCLYELMEKYQRLEKPIENIASTVFVYKKGEVVYKGSYQKWKEIDEKEYIKNLKENEKPIVEFVVDEIEYNKLLNEYEMEKTDLINKILDNAFYLLDFKYASDEIRKICWSLIENNYDNSIGNVNSLEEYIFIAKNIYDLMISESSYS